MTPDHIQDIFEDYINTQNSQYAIMINGAWGSGKTFFWKEKLLPFATGKKLKPIYISLNGIGKIESLEYQMLLGMLPYLSNAENKRIRSVADFLSNAANAVTKFFTRSSSVSDIFKGVVIGNLNYSEKLICFDDLERCQVPIEEVLGFINNFVEHKSLKVLFLADEGKLGENEKYLKAKEKIIRHTINFEPSLAELIPQIAIKFKKNDIDYYNFLIANLSMFTDILDEYKEKNLRNISFILDCLQRLFAQFSKVKVELQIEAILFIVIISLELKNGKLKSTDYNDPKNLDKIDYGFYQLLLAKRSQKMKSDEIELSYAEAICDQYLSKRIEHFAYYDSLFVFVLSGYLDIEKYKLEIEKRKAAAPSQEVLDFRKIINYNFRRLTQEEFDELAAAVWKNAVDGVYTIYDYTLLANFYYFFSQNQLIKKTEEQIKTGLISGLKIAKERFEIDDYQMSNQLAFKSTELIQEFKMIVNEVHHEIKNRKHCDIGSRLIFALRSDDTNSLKELFSQVNLTVEIFALVNKESFYDGIIAAPNNVLYDFIRFFSERYKVSNIRDFLHTEKECVDYLKTEIEKYLAFCTYEKTVKELMLKEFLVELSEISTKLA